MRANIKCGLSEDYLRKAILEFENENYTYCNKNSHNYLIMSKKTLNDLMSPYSRWSSIKNDNSTVTMYEGNRIAIDNSLEYGVVDIR